MEKRTNGIYLEREFRNMLFSRAYQNAGSLVSMATELGNSGKGRNGPVRLMWLGKVRIPGSKVERLAKLGKIPLSEVLKNVVTKDQNLEINNWFEAFEEYKNSLKNPVKLM